MTTTPVISPNAGQRDLFGDYVRKIDASVSGGRQGPQYAAASFTVGAYASSDSASDCDAFYACNATSAAVVVTAPIAAATPLGTRIKLAKVDASGNAVEFSAPDATLSNGETSHSNTTEGTTHAYTLADLNGTLTWVVE